MNLSIHMYIFITVILLLLFYRKVVEFFGLGSYLAFLYFFPVSRGFFVGVSPGLRVSLVDTHPKLR